MLQTKRLVKEIHDLQTHSLPPDVLIKESDNISNLKFYLLGPPSTPFEAGAFLLALELQQDYPSQPPKATFLTKIFHPNVSKFGEVCVNVLKQDWNPSLNISHVLSTIRCLLIEPNAESALNDDAGKLILEDYAQYVQRARVMTNIHAIRPEEAYIDCGQQPTTTPCGKDQGPSPNVLQTATINTTPAHAQMKSKKKGLRRL